MKEIILGVWLGILGCVDFKWKEIPLWFSVVGGVIGIVSCVVEEREILDVLISCLPGVLSIGVSWLTKEMIGYGDGIVLLMMGVYLPISQLLSIGMLAFFIAGIVALILLTAGRKKGSYRMPFIPFLSVAYGLECAMKIGERVL